MLKTEETIGFVVIIFILVAFQLVGGGGLSATPMSLGLFLFLLMRSKSYVFVNSKFTPICAILHSKSNIPHQNHIRNRAEAHPNPRPSI